MPINADKLELWSADILASVDTYNLWFEAYAPATYREKRMIAARQVEEAFKVTLNLTDISPDMLRRHPNVLRILRMATAPPLAADRLIGLSKVKDSLVDGMEGGNRLPRQERSLELEADLVRVSGVINRLLDKDIFPWVDRGTQPTELELARAIAVVASRLANSYADPAIRNRQEGKQLEAIRAWLEARGYSFIRSGQGLTVKNMKPGTFAFHVDVPAGHVNVSVDAVVMPHRYRIGDLPVLIEAKAAGDYVNVNKRRKEEADKLRNLRAAYGEDLQYILFLGGYFNQGYLRYEANAGIDWVWEHRIDDLAKLGLDKLEV